MSVASLIQVRVYNEVGNLLLRWMNTDLNSDHILLDVDSHHAIEGLVSAKLSQIEQLEASRNGVDNSNPQ